MNRTERRKHGLKVVNNAIKNRQLSAKKKQYGLGLVVTTQVIAVIFWRWTWTLMDRRMKGYQ